MSLREELEKAIAAQWEPDAGDDAANWLIRDHGRALLDALEDAERYRWLRDISNPAEVTILERNYEDVYVKDGEKLDAAIDTARSKTVDGGGV